MGRRHANRLAATRGLPGRVLEETWRRALTELGHAERASALLVRVRATHARQVSDDPLVRFARAQYYFFTKDRRWRDELTEITRRTPGTLRDAADMLRAAKLAPWEWPRPAPPSHLLFLKTLCRDIPLQQRPAAVEALDREVHEHEVQLQEHDDDVDGTHRETDLLKLN